jgi:hypothetical protein
VAVINSTRSEFEETINSRMESVLASVNQRNQSLREELNAKIEETWLDLEAVKKPVDTSAQSLGDEIGGK